jgi:hypothetical protein
VTPKRGCGARVNCVFLEHVLLSWRPAGAAPFEGGLACPALGVEDRW